MRTSVGVFLFFLLHNHLVVKAAPPDGLDPINNFCRRSSSAAALVGDVIIIDSGVQTFHTLDVDGIITGAMEYTLHLNLGDSWNLNTTGPLMQKYGRNTVLSNAGKKPPETIGGALFRGSSEGSVFLLGGTTSVINSTFIYAQPSPPREEYGLWQRNNDKRLWLKYSISEKPLNRLANAAAADAPQLGLAFHYNGMMDSGSSSDISLRTPDTVAQFFGGMTVVDLKNFTSRNVSTEMISPGHARAGGRMIYIPSVGRRGVLVLIGGGEKKTGVFSENRVGDMISMGSVQLFDVASLDDKDTPDGYWYSQKTSGDLPSPRADHCLTVVSAADNSNHNIYMFGGWNGKESFDDVANGTGEGRHMHSCHLATSRQIISVGGQMSKEISGEPCDTWMQGINVFDTSSLQWTGAYDSTVKNYTLPEKVSEKIMQNGKAISKPSVGWSSTYVDLLFQGKQPSPVVVTSASSGKRSQISARILLIVMPIIIVLVAGGGIGGYFIWKRRARPSQPDIPRAGWAELRESKEICELDNYHRPTDTSAQFSPFDRDRERGYTRNSFLGHRRNISELPALPPRCELAG